MKNKEMNDSCRKSKVLVIGLDGATWNIISLGVAAGKLRNLAKIIRDGVSGVLNSTMPPMTCPAWISFATGKNPGKLGVFNFLNRKAFTYELEMVSSLSIDSKCLWEILSDEGLRVGVLNIPTTFPPKKVNGFLVCGWPIPSNNVGFTYPRKLKSILDDVVGGYEVERALVAWRQSGEDSFLEGLYGTTEKEARATTYLVERYPWDFFITVFVGTDPIQHFFWKHMDVNHPRHDPKMARKYGEAILEYYEELDSIIGDLIERINWRTTTLIIMSDHGFGPVYERFHINEWLKAKGLLKLKRTSLAHLWSVIPHERLYSLLVRTGLRRFLELIPSRARELLPMFETSIGAHIDWGSTKAYSYGGVGHIFINLKGREPKGVVNPGKEYEELRHYLIEELLHLGDPITGKKFKVKAFKGEELYWGEKMDRAPDIVFVVNEFKCQVSESFAFGNVFDYSLLSAHDNAHHNRDGILMVTGKNIKKRKSIRAEIVDLAPTILYIMGVPIPRDIDGKVLKNIFVRDFLRRNPIKYAKASAHKKQEEFKYSDEEFKKIRERLETLGYIS